MKYQDVKIGMEVIMTTQYSTDILKGQKYKILRPQSEEGQNACFIVDHAGADSFLAPYCEFFEPTDPDFVPSVKSATAAEILKECTGHAHGLTDAMHIKAMKLYASEKVKEALELAAERATCSDASWDAMPKYTVDKHSITDLLPELIENLKKEK